jgi:hypothetical protein
MVVEGGDYRVASHPGRRLPVGEQFSLYALVEQVLK